MADTAATAEHDRPARPGPGDGTGGRDEQDEHDKVERLRRELEEETEGQGGADRSGTVRLAGIVLMLLGVALAFLAYVAAGNQDSGDLALDNLEHNELTILAVAGLATSLVGGALFVTASLSSLLRLWLLRQVYEHQQTRSSISARTER